MGGEDFEVAPYAVVRFNLLPATNLSEEGTARTTEAAFGRICELRDQARLAGAELAGALTDLVPTVPDASRRELLKLRRDLHNDRRPGQSTLTATLPLLDQAATARLDGWLAADATAAALTAELTDGYDAALTSERGRLYDLCAQPDFQAAAAMTSASLWQGAAGAARDDPAAPAKRTRKSEPGLLKYALRALAKTSPFSRYTAVTIGWWQDGGGQSFDVQAQAVTSYIEPGHLAIRRLLRVAASHQDSLARVKYRVARAARVDGDRLAFEVDVDTSTDAVRVESLSQQEVTMPAHPAVVRLVAAVREAGQPLPYDHLVSMAGGGDNSQERTAQAKAFINKLITLRLLVPGDEVPEQTGDIIGQARQALINLGSAPALAAAQDLAGAPAPLAELAAAPPERRLALLDDLRRTVRSAYGRFDAQPADLTVFEDAAASKPVSLDATAWKAALTNLAELGPLLRLFDNHDVLRGLFAREFVARYGPGGSTGDVYGFARLVPTIVVEGTKLDPADLSLPPDVRTMLKLRAEVKAAVSAATEAAAGQAAVQLPSSALDLARQIPASLRSSTVSYGCFVQGVPAADGSVGAVVNHLYGGFAQYASRFLRYFPAGDQVRIAEAVRGWFPAAELLVQQRPVFGFNANLHPRIADADLDLDIELDDRPGPTIRIEDLRLRHDPATNRLMLMQAATGRPVEVIYLGFLVPYALPYHLALLFLLSACGQVSFSLRRLADQRALMTGATGVRAYPRLQHGRVVLERARWYVPARELPVPAPGESDADYFVRLNLWRTKAGLPPQVFCVYSSLWRDSRAERTREAISRPGPYLVDFRSRLCVRALPKAIGDYGEVLAFEEALPEPGTDELAQSVRGRHVSELVVDIVSRPAAEPASEHLTRTRRESA
ncbi:MAG TPA: lantibiotic dehydratase [Streptosporangiaceae bacterium]|nr:lantibiotic dehydratase [Streptosporangiaceae bacterium]